MTETQISISNADDLPRIAEIAHAAFPDEDLRPLIRDLMEDPPGDVVAVMAGTGDKAFGFALFTLFNLEQAGDGPNAALLGPVGILPENQKSGAGSALINNGCRLLNERGVQVVLVLGDPAYYNRLGFQSESSIKPPYSLPDEWADAWQSLALSSGAEYIAPQTITLPKPWMHPSLWLP